MRGVFGFIHFGIALGVFLSFAGPARSADPADFLNEPADLERAIEALVAKSQITHVFRLEIRPNDVVLTGAKGDQSGLFMRRWRVSEKKGLFRLRLVVDEPQRARYYQSFVNTKTNIASDPADPMVPHVGY